MEDEKNPVIVDLFAFLNKWRLRSGGFTLIELLVVFSISAVLAGVGFASFAAYSRSQQVSQAAGDIKLLINQAKFNAVSVVSSNRNIDGEMYTCPGSLESYSVVMGTGIESNSIFLTQNCEGEEPVRLQSLVLADGFEFVQEETTCQEISFASLTSSASGGSCEIVIEGFLNKKTIEVDASGNVKVN